MRRYASALLMASAGVCSQRSNIGVATQPTAASVRDKARKNAALVPTTRFASSMFLAPTHCATITVVAIENPNMTPNSINITTFALPAAANAA